MDLHDLTSTSKRSVRNWFLSRPSIILFSLVLVYQQTTFTLKVFYMTNVLGIQVTV